MKTCCASYSMHLLIGEKKIVGRSSAFFPTNLAALFILKALTVTKITITESGQAALLLDTTRARCPLPALPQGSKWESDWR